MKKITEDAVISIINNRTIAILNTLNIQSITYKGEATGSYSLSVRLQEDAFKRMSNNETTK